MARTTRNPGFRYPVFRNPVFRNRLIRRPIFRDPIVRDDPFLGCPGSGSGMTRLSGTMTRSFRVPRLSETTTHFSRVTDFPGD
jgi:hypothetical protein